MRNAEIVRFHFLKLILIFSIKIYADDFPNDAGRQLDAFIEDRLYPLVKVCYVEGRKGRNA